MGGFSRRDFLRSGAAALATPLMFGCGSPTEPDRVGPRLTARPGSPTVAPELGLRDLDIDGGPEGQLYIPTSYRADAAFSLFIALHGANGSAKDWASYADRAETRGMIFLAIDSDKNTWDLLDRGGFGPDVVRLDRALEYVFERVRIDSEQIALGGFSDGASYSLSLGVSNGDLFTHLIAYSPGLLASAPPTVGMPKIFVSQGLSDGIFPARDTETVIIPILEDAGYDVTYLEFEGGHEVPADISDTALDWFQDGA